MKVPDLLAAARADKDDRSNLAHGQLSDVELEANDRCRELQFTQWITMEERRRHSSSLAEDVIDSAWTLAMHAESIDLQVRAFRLLARVGARRASLAFLCDRILVRRGFPQVFGTQSRLRGGRLEPWPCRNSELVERLRRHIGMEPMEAYVEYVRRRYLPWLSPRASSATMDDAN